MMAKSRNHNIAKVWLWVCGSIMSADQLASARDFCQIFGVELYDIGAFKIIANQALVLRILNLGSEHSARFHAASDILRASILYHYGGIYCDLSLRISNQLEAYRSLVVWLKSCSVVALQRADQYLPFGEIKFMASKKQSSFMRAVCDEFANLAIVDAFERDRPKVANAYTGMTYKYVYGDWARKKRYGELSSVKCLEVNISPSAVRFDSFKGLLVPIKFEGDEVIYAWFKSSTPGFDPDAIERRFNIAKTLIHFSIG